MPSRKIVGWTIYATDPNTDTILAAFAMAVKSHGVCEWVYIDNGKDYDSHALQGKTKRQRRRHIEYDEQQAAGVFGSLGVKVKHAMPYHGQSKPIERFFGTVEERFGKLWPTYCGNSPKNRPEDLQLRLERGAAPPLEEFVTAFGQWLENDYHARAHTGDAMDGQSPAAVFDQCLEVKRTVPDEVLAVLLWKPSKLLKVGQNGVTWQGLRYGVGELSLLGWLGKEVCLRIDPNDVGRVTVWTPEDQFICVARASQRLPVLSSQAELRKAIAEKRRRRKVLKEYYEQHPRLHEDLPGLILEARAEENRRKQQTAAAADRNPGPTIKPIRTAMNDQLPALRRAIKTPTKPMETVEPKLDMLKEMEAAYEADAEKKEAKRAQEQQRTEELRKLMYSAYGEVG